jgi:molecular chaperone GrpE
METMTDGPDVKVVDRRWWVRQQAEGGAEGAETPPREPEKPGYVQELEQRLAARDQEVAELLGKLREAAREFDESRVRLRKDVVREIERGRRLMIAELLEVLDNLDRAIDAAMAACSHDPLLQGVELVRRQFLSKLEGFGITRVDPLEQAFDPAHHEAVTVVPTGDPARDGVVVGVLAPGYLAGDDLLRPATVAVARLSEPSQPPGTSNLDETRPAG